jgi:hypothetical protein
MESTSETKAGFVDLDQMVSQLVAIEWNTGDPKQPN